MINSLFDIFNLQKRHNILLFLALLMLFSFGSDISSASAASYSEECPSLTVLQERYQGDCFPCEIVNVLLKSFMTACSKVYDVSKEAGNKLLLLGTFLWLAFWAMKKVSSFANVEPASSVQEILVFIGKVIVAFCFINAGIGALVSLAINPILAAGADFGTALLLETENIDVSTPPQPENQYQGPTEIISKSVMDKVLRLSEAVSNEVATNLIIGNGLTCYSVIAGFNISAPLIDIHIPDIWIWLCGAAIWCIGFMLVLCVCYYLIDIPFKIGFAIIALPVVIGLWPFNLTKSKLKSVVMIAVNAAGTFLFLALSSSYAIRLISQAFVSEQQITDENGTALSGKDAIFEAFKNDNVEYIDGLFDFTGPSFLILLFCYIYAYKLIGDITNKYPNMFFGGSMTQNAGSPMHHMATAATMWLSNKISKPFKTAANIVSYQAGKAATTVAKAGINVAGGAATFAAGKIAGGTGRFVQRATQKWVKGANELKNVADSLDQHNRINHAGMRDVIGGKFGQLGANINVSLAKAAQSLASGVEKAGDKAAATGAVPFSDIKDAFVSSKQQFVGTLADVKNEITGQTPNTQPQDDAKYAESLAQLKQAVTLPKAENIKKAFSKANLKSYLQSAKSSVIQGVKNSGAAFKADFTSSAQDFTRSRQHFQGGLQNYVKNVARAEKRAQQNIQTDAANIISAFHLRNLGKDLKRGVTGFRETWKESGPLVANKRTEQTLEANSDYVRDSRGLGRVVRPGVALIKSVSAVTNDLVDTSYNLSERTILTALDTAKTIGAFGKYVARPVGHAGLVINDAARMVIDPVLQAGGNVVNLADTAFQSTKFLTRPLMTAVGIPVGLAAKTVDTAFGLAYGATVKPISTTGRVVGLGMKTLYRGFKAKTKVGRAYTKTMHVGGKSLRSAASFLNIGRNVILAAAGEHRDFDDRDFTNKAKEQERKQQEKRQRREEKRRQEREQKERERREEREQRRQREEERRREEEEHRREEEERRREEEERRREEEERRREEEERRREEEERRREEEERNRSDS